MKKSLFVAAIGMAFFAGAAVAADLPSTRAPLAPPPPSPLPAWTGFYLGLNAGYAWSANNDVRFAYSDTRDVFAGAALADVLPSVVSLGNDGFIGGGQIGYNRQINNKFVVGLEADIQGVAADRQDVLHVGAGPVYTQASRALDYLGTVRGRLGVTVLPTLLAYATGGLAYGQANLSQTYFGPNWSPALGLASSFSDTRAGWTVGGGAEWLFYPNWSAKVEYLYFDLGAVTTGPVVYNYVTGTKAAFSGAGAAAATSRFDGHVVRAGVNYHFNLFNAEAPVAAKF